MSGEPSRETVANNLTAGYRILLFDGSDGGPMLTGGIARALAAGRARVWEEAATLIESHLETPMGVNTGSLWRNAQTKLLAEKLRARAQAAQP